MRERGGAFKGIAAPLAVHQLLPAERRRDLEADWAPMLAHQVPELPSLGQLVEALAEVAGWLGGTPVPRSRRCPSGKR